MIVLLDSAAPRCLSFLALPLFLRKVEESQMVKRRAHFTRLPCWATYNTDNFIAGKVRTVKNLFAPLFFPGCFPETFKKGVLAVDFGKRAFVFPRPLFATNRGIVLPRVYYKIRAPPSDLILTYPKQNQIGGTHYGIQLPSRTEEV